MAKREKGKIILVAGIFLVGLSMIFVSTVTVLAQDESYELLAPLPCVGGDCQTEATETTLSKYLPGIFQLAIGLAAAAAVLMIVLGGIQYMSTDAFQKKEEGKNRVWNAVKGLVFVIAAYLILYTINPKLLEFNLSIETIDVPLRSEVSTTATIEALRSACPSCSVSGQIPINLTTRDIDRLNCPNCAPLDSSLPTGGNGYFNGTPDLNNKLQTLQTNLGENVDWRITEAFPPVRPHSNRCHYGGTCVDVSLGSNQRGDQDIRNFIDTARASGFNPVYEVTSASERDRLIRILGEGYRDNIASPPGITGEHFSLY